MNLLYPILACLVGFMLVYNSIPTIINVAKVKHLFDEPNERKASKEIVPTLGGLAIFIGLTISTIIGVNEFVFIELKYLIAALIVMLFLGLKDDIQNISAYKKLFVQIATSLMLVILGDIRFTSFHGLLGIYGINYALSVIFSCFTIIVLVNSINLIDGIDGLASGVSMLIVSTFGIWFLLTGHFEYGIMCFGFVGSVAAFFLYNVFGRSNKIFMGDTGSLILGITISVIVIKFNEFNINSNAPFSVLSAPVVSISILIVPVIDTLRVFYIRIAEGRSPLSPDMNHIHHNLLKLGFNHLKSTIIITSVNAGFILLSFTLALFFEINIFFILIVSLGLVIGHIPSYILKHKHIERLSFPDFDLQKSILFDKKFKDHSVSYTYNLNSDGLQYEKNRKEFSKRKRNKMKNTVLTKNT